MKRLSKLLFLAAFGLSCNHDYQVMVREPEVIYKEVEVPVYIEVEVTTGTPAEDVEVWVDSFVQVKAVDGVDIIWVLDQSGSMNSYQPSVLSGIEMMMSALPETGWRLVMISADPNASIIEQQFPLVPGDTILDAEDMYSNIERGHSEKGFDSVHEYIQSNPYASSWMRDDAALLVVFVSDEDDQSDIISIPSDFVSWYSSMRFGNVFLASIVMLPEVDSICEYSTAGSSIGSAYIDATNLLFGTIVDICSEDWSPGVIDATSQIEPYESIELTQVPVAETIRVFVDTQLYNDWYYDSATNTVYFTILPSGGSLVEVGYVIKE